MPNKKRRWRRDHTFFNHPSLEAGEERGPNFHTGRSDLYRSGALDDPSLDYDGSWGDASKDWPAISFPTKEAAKDAYVIAWRDVKVPYGSYVLVGKDLRLETPELKQLVETHLANLATKR